MLDKEENLNQIKLQQNVFSRVYADIVFLVDVTASMQPALDGLKLNLCKFADLLDGNEKEDRIKIQWRARVIGYRDIEVDGANWWVANDFVDKVDLLKNQISFLKAEGGGGFPKNTLDALLKAAKETQWGDKRHKFIILFTDAPTKDRINKKNLEEGEKDDVKYLMQILAQKRIKLVLVAPNDNAGIYKTISAVPKSKIYSLGNESDAAVYSGLQNHNFEDLLENILSTYYVDYEICDE